MNGHFYSPSHNADNTPPPGEWNLEIKINIFEARVNGWFLDVADQLRSNDAAGYAILSIILCYFEMIELYIKGITQDLDDYGRGQRTREPSKEHFKGGVRRVAQHSNWPQNDLDTMSDRLYTAFRCGIYHGGMTRQGALITEDPNMEAVYQVSDANLIIKPRQLLSDVQKHFKSYISDLRQKQSSDKFSRRFDAEVMDD